METLLVWLTRLLLLAMGAAAAVWLGRWLRDALRERREKWAVRTGLLMLLLGALYVGGHLWLLVNRSALEAGRMRYAAYGDPRLAELRRAEIRGWLLDCTGEDEPALARYGRVDGRVARVHPLGEAGANLVGGGVAAEQRDFTLERLFAGRLREAQDWTERGQLHGAGRDLRMSLCSGVTRQAWQLLRAAGRPGAVVIQEVSSGAVVGYAATGGPEDAPVGIRRYAPPGSVFKLALAALWWESELPEVSMGCPASSQVAPGAVISNFGQFSIPAVQVPHGMLVPSCNTTAVEMALTMREQLGTQAFLDTYRRFGFLPYDESPPRGTDRDFWSTSSAAWRARMSPPPSRLRMSERTGPAEWAQLAIGQGPLDVTVIAVSRFLQAIGNQGIMLKPTLEGERAVQPEEVERIMTSATSQRLQAAMLDVVQRGTARSALPRLRGTGWALGGKTGTAQVQRAADDGWFAGLVYDVEERPRYTIVVYLQGGGPGGGRPTSVAAEMARFLAENEAALRERS